MVVAGVIHWQCGRCRRFLPADGFHPNMETAWAESLRDQCGAAGVAFFTKQIATEAGRAAKDRKGGDPKHWPPGDWPRQFPRRTWSDVV